MISTSFVAMVLAILPSALATYEPSAIVPPVVHPTSTAIATPPKQTVAVGKDGLTFTPNTIHAKKGEEVVFEFYPKNHAVVQADFNNPCNPSANESDIYSGFIPSMVGRADRTFTVQIEDEHKPMWLYCPQNNPRSHCAAGMVAVINPPAHSPNTLDAFKAAAANTGNATFPSSGPSGGRITVPEGPEAPGAPGTPGASSSTSVALGSSTSIALSSSTSIVLGSSTSVVLASSTPVTLVSSIFSPGTPIIPTATDIPVPSTIITTSVSLSGTVSVSVVPSATASSSLTVTGIGSGAPSASGAPSTPSNEPVEFPGAGSWNGVNSVLGVVAFFAVIIV